MITLDTSALYAILNRRDPHHAHMRTARDADAGPYLVPAGILSEITYMIESALSYDVLVAFVLDLGDRAYDVDCGEHDFHRIVDLVRRYHDLPLGFADSAVVACAERHGGRVLTADYRHFGVVARGERTIEIVPVT